MLYYPTNDYKLFSFNVDTRENTKIDIGRKIWSIASFTGIDCKVKTVFQCFDDTCTYTLNNDNSVTKVNEKQSNSLSVIFPLTSNPKNINNAVLKYGGDLIKCGNKLNTDDLIKFGGRSVIRIYKDIFLACDDRWLKKSWVLLRIHVP